MQNLTVALVPAGQRDPADLTTPFICGRQLQVLDDIPILVSCTGYSGAVQYTMVACMSPGGGRLVLHEIRVWRHRR